MACFWRLIFLSLLVICSADGQCTAATAGKKICVDCTHEGTCGTNPPYDVIPPAGEQCPPRYVCDSTQFEFCALLSPADTNCCASKLDECKYADGSSNEVIVCNCSDYARVPCANNFNPATCTCNGAPLTCPVTTVPSSSTSTTVGSSTTSTTTTTATVATARPPCPACGYLDFSASDCRKYYYCRDGSYTVGQCPTNTCFDSPSCSCVIQAVTTTKPILPTTRPACPACGYVDFSPTDCPKYQYCADGSYTLGACPGNTCFTTSTCSCQVSAAKSITCPDCGYMDDPNSTDCTKFVYCGEGSNTAGQCPNSTCFSPTTCSCTIN